MITLEIAWDYRRDEKGRVKGFCSVITDITNREQTRLDLVEREAMLRTSQDIARIGSWQMDLSTHEVKWSDQVYQLFGMAKGHKSI